jgi:hypothetical protein
MHIVILIIAALVMPATMLVLSVSVNEFDKSARALFDAAVKRYTYEPMKKSGPGSEMPPMAKPSGKT